MAAKNKDRYYDKQGSNIYSSEAIRYSKIQIYTNVQEDRPNESNNENFCVHMYIHTNFSDQISDMNWQLLFTQVILYRSMDHSHVEHLTV